MCGFSHSATRALVSLGPDSGQEDQGYSQCFHSPQWMDSGSWLEELYLSSSTPALANHVFMTLTLCTGSLSCCNKSRPLNSSNGKGLLYTTECFHHSNSLGVVRWYNGQVSTYCWLHSAAQKQNRQLYQNKSTQRNDLRCIRFLVYTVSEFDQKGI